MMTDYSRFKSEFVQRSGESVNIWKALVDFHGIKMGEEEKIEIYADRYNASRKLVDEDGCVAVKYFFSLPLRVRELLSRHAGEWPSNLKGMVKLSKEVILRNETINFGKPTITMAATTRGPIVCFGCGEKGHIASRCLNKNKAKEKLISDDKNNNITKSNSIKDTNANYSCSSVYVKAVLVASEKKFSLSALIDSGATANYISENVVRQ